MSRIYLCWAAMAALSFDATGFAATRIARGTQVFDNIPEAAADLAERLDGYLAARQAAPLGWTPKGQLLISTRFADVEQLHMVERPGGARRQLTFLHEAITTAVASPDPVHDAFAYLSDATGSGLVQIYYQHVPQSAGFGPAKLLTDGKSVNGGAVWSNSGHELAFFTTARDGISYDIDIVEPGTGSLPHLAMTGDGALWAPLDWSPDDRKLLVRKTVSASESYLYVVDLATGQKHEVDPGTTKTAIMGAKFARDGQGVYLISDRDGDFAKLRYCNLFTNEKSVLSSALAGDVEELALSRDGHYLGFVTNESGVDKLSLVDLRSHQDLTPPQLPLPGFIDHLYFDTDGKRLAFGYSTLSQPRDAYVLDLAANHLEAWTRSELGAVDGAQFVAPHLVQFPSFDRPDGRNRQLPAYVYEPRGAGPHAVLVLLHDGPAAQFRPGFDPFLQYVVNELGFAVVAPNLRGSTGYGKTFMGLDKGMLRDDVIKDVGALIVWVGLQSIFDAKHVVVAGSGNGGYLALAALVNYNDRLAGAVDVEGIADFISGLSGAAPYRQGELRAEYGDERDPNMRAFLRRISPLTNADRISRPLLVVQNKNDTRIPAAQADQIVNRLRSRSGDIWYLQFADESTDITRASNRDAYYKTVAQFLKTLR